VGPEPLEAPRAVASPAPVNGTMARTVADAQAVGHAALRLAYDVGAVLGQAARGLVSATLNVADTVAPRRVLPAGRGRSPVRIGKSSGGNGRSPR